MQVLRRRPFANASRSIVMRPVAGTEPSPEIACAIAERDTSQMRADTDHHQIGVMARNGAVLVLHALEVRDGGAYLDGTFGAGGYSRAILSAASSKLRKRADLEILE